MRPKFEVGEVVILQSKNKPECNGEYVVDYCSVCPIGTKFNYSGYDYTHSLAVVGYFLDGANNHKGEPILFSESALRKKHTPGEMSFTDLMASLSSPKLITHQT